MGRSPRYVYLLLCLCELAVLVGRASGAAADALGTVQFPLHVSADGRRLEDSRGQPLLIHGDAAWSLMVNLDLAEVETYLEDRRQRGFNAVIVNLIERGFGGPSNRDGQPPFVPADTYSAPNPAYFAHADAVIDLAAAKGMLVLLTPSYLGAGCGTQGWCQQMLDEPVTAMTSYGHFLGDRYKDRTNIIWVNGGDADARDYSGALTRVNAIANAIRERAPGQLQTAHCSRFNSAVECYNQPWLDINNTYSECNESLPDIQADQARLPVKPFFYIEGKYENEDATLGCLIDQAVWPTLSGSTGQVFGNNPIWLFDPGWPAALNSVGSRAFANVGALLRSRAWFRLQPDLTNAVLVSGGGNGAVAARSSDGESLMIYIPTPRQIAVDLDQLSGSKAHLWRFNPQTGSTVDGGELASSGLFDFTAGSRMVLVIDNYARHLPAPGSTPYWFGADVPSAALPLRTLLAALLLATRRWAERGRRRTSRRS